MAKVWKRVTQTELWVENLIRQQQQPPNACATLIFNPMKTWPETIGGKNEARKTHPPWGGCDPHGANSMLWVPTRKPIRFPLG